MRPTVFVFLTFSWLAPLSHAQELPKFEPTWFIGNTEKFEWIRFQKIHLTKGNYRFTGNLGATVANGQVEIVLRHCKSGKKKKLGVFRVPKQKTQDQFELVHLGRTPIQTGDYDVYLTFLSSGVSADFLYLRKSDASEDRVLPDDLNSPAPAHGKTRVTPIGPYQTPSKFFKFQDYNSEQCKAWYRQSLNIGLDRPDGIRSAIETAVSARLDWCWLHGRAAIVKPEWDWGVDREVVPSPGRLPGHRLKHYFDVLETVPYAKHLRYSYFCDNVYFGKFFSNHHDGKKAEWNDKQFQDFIWKNWIRAWYEHVPRNRHMLNENGRVFLYFWTADCGVGGDKCYEFFVDLKSRLKKEFNLEVDFILPSAFAKKDPRVLELTYAQPAWFYWTQEENITFKTFEKNGRTLAFATNGRRHPINSIWETDWDPKSGKGTRKKNDKHPDDGYYRPTRSRGRSKITDYEIGLRKANRLRAKWMVLESWGNQFEGSTWFRSDHPDYKFPNEFINITRKFCDTDTAAIMLQAEFYDDARDLTPGNDGKAYRYSWLYDREPDVDIYRPLHQLSPFQKRPLQRKFQKIVAGTHDVWGIDKKGIPVANEIDGNANWKPAKSNKLKFAQLTFGKKQAWCVAEQNLHHAYLPEGWKYHNTSQWQRIKLPFRLRSISSHYDSTDLWCLDQSGQLWFGEKQKNNPDGKPKIEWKKQDNQKLKQLAVGRCFLWGIDKNGDLLRRETHQGAQWSRFAKQPGFIQLACGSDEVWALHSKGELYRMPDSGRPFMEQVTDEVKAFSVGRGYAWILKQDGAPQFCKLTGFKSMQPELKFSEQSQQVVNLAK